MSRFETKKPVTSIFAGGKRSHAPEDDLYQLDRMVLVDDPSELELGGGIEEQKAGAADSIDVDMLEKLKKEFKFDENGDCEGLELDEFIEKCGAVLGANLSRRELEYLFMKIDANSDGSVDWDEFTNFLLQVHQQKDKMKDGEPGGGGSEFSEKPLRDATDPSRYHHDMIDRIVLMGELDKYVTISRDGTFSVWTGGQGAFIRNMSPFGNTLSTANTISAAAQARSSSIAASMSAAAGTFPGSKQASTPWMVDAAFMPLSNKLAICALDRSINFFDTQTFEPLGRIRDAKMMEHIPMCMQATQVQDKEILTVGDNAGNVSLLNFQPNWHVCDGGAHLACKHGEPRRTGVAVHKLTGLHRDWVTKVRYISDLSALVTCSLDCTVNLCDPEKIGSYERFRHSFHTFRGHTKGVYSLDWSRQNSFIASCGLERNALVWDPHGCLVIARLPGHTASVQEILIDDSRNQIMTLSTDKFIRIWDCRNFRCIQTFQDSQPHRPEDRITAMAWDARHSSLLTGTNRLQVWPVRMFSKRVDLTHEAPLCTALYNRSFSQVVTSDETAVVCSWNIQTGQQMFRYRESLHDDSKLTAMCFDDGGRRLVTGYHNGTLRMTNFSSGECLTEFVDRRRVDDGQQEVTAVAFVRERKSDSNAQYLVSVGWDRQLTVWPDSGDGGEQSPRRVANDDVEAEKQDSDAESSENDSDVEYFSDSDEPRSSPRLRSLALPVHSKDAPLMSARSSNGAPSTSRTAREQVDQRTQRRRQLLSERDAGPQTSRQATRGHTDDILCIALCHESCAATGGHDGAIVIWNCESGYIREKLVPPPEALQEAGVPLGGRLPTVEQAVYAAHARLLITCGNDGWIRFWDVQRSRMVMQMDGMHRRGEALVALSIDVDQNQYFMTGDSSGAVRVWDMSRLTERRQTVQVTHRSQTPRNITTAEHISADLIDRVLYFQPHKQTVVSLDYIRQPQPLLLTGSTDGTAVLWTMQGRQVGIFGQSVKWALEDPDTYRERAPSPDRVYSANAVLKAMFYVEQTARHQRAEAAAIDDDIETLTRPLQFNFGPTTTTTIDAAANSSPELSDSSPPVLPQTPSALPSLSSPTSTLTPLASPTLPTLGLPALSAPFGRQRRASAMPLLGGITEEQSPLPALPGPGAMPSLSALGKPFARPLVQPKKRVATFGSVKPAPFESDAVVAERAQTERAKIAEKAKSEDKFQRIWVLTTREIEQVPSIHDIRKAAK